MKIPLYLVDAFTVQPFRGNTAAVCLLQNSRSDEWMQAVAEEMDYSETAFLVPHGHDYQLRWFTPTVEVDLCGHATLASAHVLYEFGYYEPDEEIKFTTKSGVITASFQKGTIELDMPRREPVAIESTPEIEAAIGLKPVSVEAYEDKVLLVELADREQVETFQPDFKLISALPYEGVLLTAACADGPTDFVSRFFSPRTGINEDPVTGMAHCVLGPYWEKKLGKSKFKAYQASKRGGEVQVRTAPDRIYIGGKAVTVVAGELQHQKE